MASTGSQPAWDEPPSSQAIARRSSPVERSIRKEVRAVAKEREGHACQDQVGGRNGFSDACQDIDQEDGQQVRPAKAAAGTAIRPQNEYGHWMLIASTAPSPAPEATPIR